MPSSCGTRMREIRFCALPFEMLLPWTHLRHWLFIRAFQENDCCEPGRQKGNKALHECPGNQQQKKLKPCAPRNFLFNSCCASHRPCSSGVPASGASPLITRATIAPALLTRLLIKTLGPSIILLIQVVNLNAEKNHY